MALTPGGTPYVESSDLVANYPATSLALGNHVDLKAGNPLKSNASVGPVPTFLIEDTGTDCANILHGAVEFKSNDPSGPAGVGVRVRLGAVGNTNGGNSNFTVTVANASGVLTERLRINEVGLITGTGSSLGPFTSFTPTVTQFTLGNGTISAGWMRIGQLVYYRGTITAGSTSAFSTTTGQSISVNYPITPIAANSSRIPLLSKTLTQDQSLGKWLLGDAFTETTTLSLRWPRVDSGQPIMGGFNTVDGVPFTLAANDAFFFSVLYEGA